MEFNYKVIKSKECKTNEWSGGTTTQLYIYPENSSYEKRDFTWRISSATVDIEKSDFTDLPDYNRILMVLKGKLLLNHENQYSVNLCELEQDKFGGCVKTTSEGKVTDFNLMMKKSSCTGNVEIVYLEPKSTLTTVYNIEKLNDYKNCSEIYYNIKSNIALSINESKKIVLCHKDLLIINYKNKENEEIKENSLLFDSYNSEDEDAILIKTKVYY